MHICGCFSPDDSLFAKALSYAVTVVKGDRVQDRATTSHVRRELSSVATNGPFV